MPIVQVILLGIIQGFAEFLPISSSAHLAVAGQLGERFFGWPDQGLGFDIALHVGTLIAVLAYFLKDWIQVIGQAFGIKAVQFNKDLARNTKLLWLLVIASLPIGVAGLLFQKTVEEELRNNLFLIGAMLILVGLAMLWGELLGSRKKSLGKLSFVDAAIIGVAQALAIVPGTSRSGITITAALLRNLDRRSAARFSFLAATPVILAAGLKDLYDLFKHEGGIPHEMRMAFLIGISVSAITGGIVIKFFLDFLAKRSLNFFVWYRVGFGIIVIALAIFRQTGG